jgi:hypothetical protein
MPARHAGKTDAGRGPTTGQGGIRSHQSATHVLEGKITKWKKAHPDMAAKFRLTGCLRHDLASMTPDALEYLFLASRQSSVSHWSGRRGRYEPTMPLRDCCRARFGDALV